MIFRVKDEVLPAEITVSSILEHVELVEFLNRKWSSKSILTCPVDALDVEKNLINENCIDCALCWIKDDMAIEKDTAKPDYQKFLNYLMKDKMFVYKWLSLCIKDYSGVEIKSPGFSRVRRIPLIVNNKNNIYIFKVIREVADVDKALLDIQDTIDLSKESFNDFEVFKVLVIIDDFINIPKTDDKTIVLKLEKIYKKIFSNGKVDILEIIK